MAYNGKKLAATGWFKHYYCHDCAQYFTGPLVDGHLTAYPAHRMALVETGDVSLPPGVGAISEGDFLDVHMRKTSLPRSSIPWEQLSGEEWDDPDFENAFPWSNENALLLGGGDPSAPPYPHVVDLCLIPGDTSADKPRLVVLWFQEDPQYPLGPQVWWMSVYDPYTGAATGTGYAIGSLGSPDFEVPVALAYNRISDRVVVLAGNATFGPLSALPGGKIQLFDRSTIYHLSYGVLTPVNWSGMSGAEALNLGQDLRSNLATRNNFSVALIGGSPVSSGICVWIYDHSLHNCVAVPLAYGASAALHPDGGIVMDSYNNVHATFAHPSDPTVPSEIVIGDYTLGGGLAKRVLPVLGGTNAFRCQSLARAGNLLLYPLHHGSYLSLAAHAQCGVGIAGAPMVWSAATWWDAAIDLKGQVHNLGNGLPVCFDGTNFWFFHTRVDALGGGQVHATYYPAARIMRDSAAAECPDPIGPILDFAAGAGTKVGRTCFDGARVWCIPQHHGGKVYSVPMTVYGR